MRYFIYLQYDGTNYHGWQTQPNAVSVQETIEKKLSLLLRREILIVGAGRTDTGVHARSMTAHFDLDGTIALQNGRLAIAPLSCHAADATEDEISQSNSQDPDALSFLCHKLNDLLPADISIDRIIKVRPEAHARFSPTARTYRYYITAHKSPFNHHYAYRVFWQLDVEKMNEAASHLFDYQDFTSFSRLHTDVKTNNCTIRYARWEDDGQGNLTFTITADRFLRNMVRAIVGTLILVGRHKLTVEEFCQTIERKNRCSAGDSAPAHALFLEEVTYPQTIFY